MLMYLLQQNASVDDGSYNYRTPLHSAVDSEKVNIEVVKCLVDNQSDVNARDGDNATPIQLCLSSVDNVRVDVILAI